MTAGRAGGPALQLQLQTVRPVCQLDREAAAAIGAAWLVAGAVVAAAKVVVTVVGSDFNRHDFQVRARGRPRGRGPCLKDPWEIAPLAPQVPIYT